ncbi:heptaprenyl diphosphate synthase component 1 [Pasteuria penetrans]|uniref:heptaprenyl diphosphate synthase component 1 n=1 Tax=Pasteuria penetrans TaxID=86005 RepID=UPI000F975A56|nr:heptaprenyl diphosphate synthase component 1 [Pasteuria penetrans]
MTWERVAEDVQASLRYPVLMSIVAKLPVPVSFLRCLWLILREQNWPSAEGRVIARAATLLQMGLDIHDRVKELPVSQRSAWVLTGDYCSALFYRILVQYDALDALSLLSEAVCQVNEAKALHKSRLIDSKASVIQIQAGLLCPLLSHLCSSASRRVVWREVTEQTMLGLYLRSADARQAALAAARSLPEWVQQELRSVLSQPPTSLEWVATPG